MQREYKTENSLYLYLNWCKQLPLIGVKCWFGKPDRNFCPRLAENGPRTFFEVIASIPDIFSFYIYLHVTALPC